MLQLGGKTIQDPLIQIGSDDNGMPCYQVWARDRYDWKPEYKNKFRWHSYAYTFAIRPEQAVEHAIQMLTMSGMFN